MYSNDELEKCDWISFRREEFTEEPAYAKYTPERNNVVVVGKGISNNCIPSNTYSSLKKELRSVIPGRNFSDATQEFLDGFTSLTSIADMQKYLYFVSAPADSNDTSDMVFLPKLLQIV
ncbi:hypothetical protein HPULCUR_002775 [Helicostylum pulchrum]|uniref:Uncharacterized protein n=1 Tax=Helicostylum pulchrum TaxID=562976 RepID=A0ABP9XRG6_9FUNG